jgi:hypothetical protein
MQRMRKPFLPNFAAINNLPPAATAGVLEAFEDWQVSFTSFMKSINKF